MRSYDKNYISCFSKNDHDVLMSVFYFFIDTSFSKYVHMFRYRGVDKIKYRHEGIMIILITAT